MENVTAPEDALRINLVPELPPFGGYEDIVTAMDVFSRYLFAHVHLTKTSKGLPNL